MGCKTSKKFHSSYKLLGGKKSTDRSRTGSSNDLPDPKTLVAAIYIAPGFA